MRFHKEEGQGIVEYALILILVAIIVCSVLGCIAAFFIGGSAVGLTWITNNWDRLMSGDPGAIAIAVVIAAFILMAIGYFTNFVRVRINSNN